MNPLLQAALSSILRHVITIGATYLVTRGIWTPEDASTYVTAAAMATLSIGWAVWQKYATHLAFLEKDEAVATALTLPKNSTPETLQRAMDVNAAARKLSPEEDRL